MGIVIDLATVALTKESMCCYYSLLLLFNAEGTMGKGIIQLRLVLRPVF